MVKKLFVVGLVLFLCGMLFSLFSTSYREVKAETSPGMDKYTPTKLEWAAVELNAYFRDKFAEGSFFVKQKFEVSYRAKTPDTIIVRCAYSANMSRPDLNKLVEALKKMVSNYASRKGFGDWLKVEEETRILK